MVLCRPNIENDPMCMKVFNSMTLKLISDNTVTCANEKNRAVMIIVKSIDDIYSCGIPGYRPVFRRPVTYRRRQRG